MDEPVIVTPKEKPSSKKFRHKLSKRIAVKRNGKGNSAGSGDGKGEGEAVPVSLGDALEEAKVSVDLFLNNGFEEARGVVQPM